MVPVRRWKPLVFAVIIWLLGAWYMFGNEGIHLPRSASLYKPTAQEAHPFQGTSSHAHDDKLHWKQLPERYPVTSIRALPTGRSSVKIAAIQKSPAPVESPAQKQTRIERQAAVKASFEHSWGGYRRHAWLHDEVTPLTGDKSDPFGGWAATLVDALDTLWIMGLKDDFQLAVKACTEIDFTTTQSSNINVFETTIRYLGGFLAAFELSEGQYPELLNKAAEVGLLLMSAFDTPNRMPITRWEWEDYTKGHAQKAPKTMLVSEIGSLSLEFTKLSQLTGDMRFYDAIQRISDEFEQSQSKTKLPGMWPVVVNAQIPSFSGDNFFTLGGMSDSLYEYLPKQYLLLGGALEQPRRMYENFIDVAQKHLFRRVLNPDNTPLLISGDVRVKSKTEMQMSPRAQHLTCFTGGMVGIGARIFNRPADIDVAIQLANACVWSYLTTESGIGPEIFHVAACGTVGDSQTSDKCQWSDQKWREAIKHHWIQPATDSSEPEETGEVRKKTEAKISSIIEKHRLPPGMVDVGDRKYILRPEAIESVFVMYRITGDPGWMDKAWHMWVQIEKHTRTDVAAASLDDVTKSKPTQVDSMESFWLAETLKYFYLVFADWDTVSLDKWVLNTEAHPLRRPYT